QAMLIRPCHDGEFDTLLAIINAAASKYRGVIPDDCWHEPYMSSQHLRDEIADGVQFIAAEIDGSLAGVMGIQPVRNVELIRHAYVRPEFQGRGLGGALIAHLKSQSHRQILVGTWRAATWAIRFYETHQFQLVPESVKAELLKTYWTIPARQIDTSVVLASPALNVNEAQRLMQASR
ncbi:MAG: GNAT family N-acetyltransferase, partial [Steroidobacter sp.]